MNRKTFWMIVLVLLSVTYVSGCGSSSHVTVTISTPPPAVLAPNGTAQIIATVTGTSEGVNWSCTPVGSCGSFNPPSTPSLTATTYTAPSTVGPVVITATSEKKASVTASVNVTIQVNNGLTGNFAFYASGLEGGTGSPATLTGTYSVAGAVTILADGTLTGEQDYNDGDGLTSPAAMITSGNLSIDANGFGTMTLVTSDTSLGVGGTETFTVNFVNNSHALIIESDGRNTSSGSMDLQTLPSTLTGNFAFAVSGIGPLGEGTFSGGVLTITGTTVAGTYDVNDEINGPTTGNTFTGATLGAPDTFGRGLFTDTPFGVTVAYYIVGPEAIRIIDVDTTDTAVGSAFGQGTGTFTNASLPTSVFIDQGTYGSFMNYDAVGQIAPNGLTSGAFTGIADVNEVPPTFVDAAAIAGTYTIGANGYGSLTITGGTLLDVTQLGVYMVDPTINVNDPNNTSGGGGALLLDLSANVEGTGVLVPQTSTSNSDFTGNYVLGFQDILPFMPAAPILNTGEVDFVGNAAVTTSLTGSGTLSDPFGDLGLNPSATVSFAAPITPDPVNTGIGRYTISPFSVSNGAATPVTIPYSANVYQASGGQLFWIEDGEDGLSSVFGGQLQQQGTIGVAAAKKRAKQ
ncbi:MAG: hypothetical protein WCD49_13160 [Candidatus Acidiferrales bacterium]